MSSAIEWSLGLPCPDQRDAILASVVDPARDPGSAAAAEHLRRCPACRAFRESLRTQRVLVRKLAEEQQEEKKKRERQRKLRSEMTEWVDQELKVRGERELGRLLWRVGTALLRLEPRVARQVFTETKAGPVDETSIAKIITDTISELESDVTRSDKSHDSTLRARRTLASLGNALSSSSGFDLKARIDLIWIFADLAEALSGSIHCPVRLLRANVEWYYGNESLVPELVRQALDSASDQFQRAHAFANLALWESTRGSFDSASALVREASQCFSLFASSHVNLAVWATVVGDRRGADRGLAEAAAIVGPRQFRNYWPWTLVFGWLNRCAELTDASPRDHTRAVDSMWVAYHRRGGLPPSHYARPVTSRSESSS